MAQRDWFQVIRLSALHALWSSRQDIWRHGLRSTQRAIQQQVISQIQLVVVREEALAYAGLAARGGGGYTMGRRCRDLGLIHRPVNFSALHEW